MYSKGLRAKDRYSYTFRKMIERNVFNWASYLTIGNAFIKRNLPNGHHVSYTGEQQQLLDEFHCWSIFMTYWPAVAFCSLIGKE